MKAKGAALAARAVLNPNPVTSSDYKRDAYWFAVRPQHLQRYREYANIYKEEEEERSDRWKNFLERQAESVQLGGNLSDKDNAIKSNVESTKVMIDDPDGKKPNHDSFVEEKKTLSTTETKVHCIQIWTEISQSSCYRGRDEFSCYRKNQNGKKSTSFR